MTIELPVLRLGLAGFSADQHAQLAAKVRSVAVGVVNWEICELDAADAWLVNGAKVQDLGENRIRINPGVPTARSIQLHLPDVDRPMAFALPCKLAGAPFTFDMASRPGLAAVLHRFECLLGVIVSQFCLAAHIVEHETAVRSGCFDLRCGDKLIARVRMPSETAVLPTAGPDEFENAAWERADDFDVPDQFAPASMSHLMWQYSTRTQRDVLPKHYRTGALYFRRAPRVAQRFLTDSHLFLLRELNADSATFDALQRRSGLAPEKLARALAALYFVGAITSNPKRAARPPMRTADAEMASGPHSNLPHSNLPSGMDSVPPDLGRRPGADPDLTAPAPIGIR